jgi:hypothetical protein
MTEPTTPAEPAPDTVLEPFLRITSTYPVDGDRFHTIQLEMHLGAQDELAEQGDTGDTGTRSWFIDLCTCVIAQLRRPPVPAQVKVTGVAVPVLLADQVQHVDGCAGQCGFPPAGPPSETEPDADAGPAAAAGGN